MDFKPMMSHRDFSISINPGSPTLSVSAESSSTLLATQPWNLLGSSLSLESHSNKAQSCQCFFHNSLQTCPFYHLHLSSDLIVDFHNTCFTSSPLLSLTAQTANGHQSYFLKGRSGPTILKYIPLYPLTCAYNSDSLDCFWFPQPAGNQTFFVCFL